MLPSLEHSQPTLHSLYAVARLLGAVRTLAFERQPNFLHLGMKVVPAGLSTDTLPTGGEITLDMRRQILAYVPAQGASHAVAIPLEGETQSTLLETLLTVIYPRELAALIPHTAGESYTEAVFKAVPTLINRGNPPREALTAAQPLHFDAQAATDYAQALYSILTAVARFHARLNGALTPIVVWPEHFDLSFLWFAAEPDENQPHLNFGFAPYSYGIDEPYLYVYAYPYPAHLEPPALPPGARWNTEGWTGVVLPYTEIARQSDPEAYVESSCIAIYRALRPLLGA